MTSGQRIPVLEGNIVKLYPQLSANEIIYGNKVYNCLLDCPPDQCCNTIRNDDLGNACKKCRVQSLKQGTNKTGLVNFYSGYCRDCGNVTYDIRKLLDQPDMIENDVKRITNITSIDCSQKVVVNDVEGSNVTLQDIENICASTIQESPLRAILENKQSVIIIIVVLFCLISLLFLI